MVRDVMRWHKTMVGLVMRCHKTIVLVRRHAPKILGSRT